MARSLLALLACLALAAPCLADTRPNDVVEVSHEVFLVDDAAPALHEAPLKEKRSELDWGSRYTTWRPPTRRPTTRRPWPTTRRPSSTHRPWSTTRDSQDQSFNMGGVYPWDTRLSQTPVYKKATSYVNSLDFKYTDPAKRAIHCVQVVDMQKNGKNAAVTLVGGGINQSYINLRFKSRRGGNINYLVVVWGQ